MRISTLGVIGVILWTSPFADTAAQDFPAGRAPEADVSVPLSAEATEFIRGLILLAAPRQFEDDDDWGRRKRVQSGLNVDLDGLRFDTSRRWKNVNHGIWQRAIVSLVDPEQFLTLRVLVLPTDDRGIRRFRVTASTRVKVTGRQQQWNYGVRLYSVSGDALADLSVDAVFSVRNEIVTTADGTSLRFLPHVESASVRLDGFRLQRVSHMKGAAVREFARAIQSVLDRRLRREGPKLAGRINSRVQQKPERFQIPLGQLSLFGGGESGAAAVESQAAPAEAPLNPGPLVIPSID